MAEMLLAAVLGRIAEEDEIGSEALNPVLPDM
jgi:hypothetical protein